MLEHVFDLKVGHVCPVAGRGKRLATGPTGFPTVGAEAVAVAASRA
jgi:hypothetical protein